MAGRIQRGQAKPSQLGHLGEQPLEHGAEARPAGQIPAVGGDIDPGDGKLGMARAQQRARLGDDRRQRHAAAGTAAEGDAAEGAAVIAALLDLQETARPPLQAVHRQTLRPTRGHDVADLDPGARSSPGPALGPQLLRVAQQMVDLGHRGVGVRCQLHGAAGDHDARGWAAATQPADGLTRLALRLGGDGAGVHDHRVAGAGGTGKAAHHLRLRGC